MLYEINRIREMKIAASVVQRWIAMHCTDCGQNVFFRCRQFTVKSET